MNTTHPGRPYRVALLEDNTELRDAIIAPGLREYGFDVFGVSESKYLFMELVKGPIDIAVIDIGLPHESGLDVARALRGVSQAGIVIMTSNLRKEARLAALLESADAFLSKPTDVDVLAATLRSVLRRIDRQEVDPVSPGPAMASWRLGKGDWSIRSPAGTLVPLTLLESRLLRIVVDARGQTVTRESLYLCVDPDPLNFDGHRLDMIVHRLRGKVLKLAGEKLPLLTHRAVGYSVTPEDFEPATP